MDEDFFLNNYADGLMIDWFRQLSQSGKGSFLEILSIIRCSPLGILDQFTVKGNTEQPDGWNGLRLVFAIRNDARASPRTNLISIGLKPTTIGDDDPFTLSMDSRISNKGIKFFDSLNFSRWAPVDKIQRNLFLRRILKKEENKDFHIAMQLACDEVLRLRRGNDLASKFPRYYQE